MEHNHGMVSSEYSAREVAKFTGVLAGITVAAFVLQKIFQTTGLTEWLRWFMGVFFLIFGSFKLIGYGMFAEMFSGYDVVAKRFKPYAYAYPFLELILALAYLTNQFSPLRDWLTLVIMAIGSIGVAQELQKRSGIHCACLGNIIKLPLSVVSLVEDVGMGLMALIMIIWH